MTIEQDYLEVEKKEIERLYGRCNDDTIRQFVDEGLAQKFHNQYLKKHNIKSLNECIRE